MLMRPSLEFCSYISIHVCIAPVVTGNQCITYATPLNFTAFSWMLANNMPNSGIHHAKQPNAWFASTVHHTAAALLKV